jgi:hypothetical protein
MLPWNDLFVTVFDLRKLNFSLITTFEPFDEGSVKFGRILYLRAQELLSKSYGFTQGALLVHDF